LAVLVINIHRMPKHTISAHKFTKANNRLGLITSDTDKCCCALWPAIRPQKFAFGPPTNMCCRQSQLRCFRLYFCNFAVT